jgi:hypothetical protein
VLESEGLDGGPLPGAAVAADIGGRRGTEMAIARWMGLSFSTAMAPALPGLLARSCTLFLKKQ